jgi:cell division protein FtsQ
MRQVSRLALRRRLAPRSRPRPRWLRPVQIAAATAAVALALGAGLKVLAGLGILDDARQRLEAGLLDASGRAGLVVRNVLAEGRQRTPEPELVQTLEKLQGTFILTVDSRQLKERLESLPWVRSATVVRQFPDTLIARLEEHHPLALWLHEKRRRLIGKDGEIIPAPVVGRHQGLPVLTGAGAPERAPGLFRILGSDAALSRRVTQATLIAGRRWNVWLDHRVEVRLPETGEEEAWRFLAAEQRRTALLDRAIEAVDLRHPGWIVLRLIDEPKPRASGQRA